MEEEQLEIINDNENIQLAENENVDNYDNDEELYANKRELLEKTRIVKQTWSIIEIYQKINDKKLILDPEYQRNVIWDTEKKTSFIESLYMGIVIPPIYVVEIPNDDILVGSRYEVVDGKQRLSTIRSFIGNELVLKKKNLEYYADLFGEKKFSEIKEANTKETTEMLSSVLDVYVITANSPEFTKYDIFSRLNKGSEKLRVNEIRKAVYHSELTKTIDEFVKNNQEKEEYKEIFTINDRKRYEDYGRFYKSIAFYIRSNIQDEIVERYNSRPREMINDVLQEFQNKMYSEITNEVINDILDKTIKMLILFKDFKNKDYLIDACIPFVVHDWEKFKKKVDTILEDKEILSTFQQSYATTANVNKRLSCIIRIMKE